MTLNELFTNIANAIRRKKGTTDKIIPTNFESEIDNISTGIETDDATASANDILKDKVAYGVEGRIVGAIETYDGASDVGEVIESSLKKLLDNTKSVRGLFYQYNKTNWDEIIQYNDTENVENFYQTFMYNDKISLFPQINTTNAILINEMYSNCSKIKEAKIESQKITNFNKAFYSCFSILKVDIARYTYSNYNCQQIFYNCNILKAVIIRSFGDTYALDSSAVFYNCYWLLGTTHSKYNPNGEQGYIYVPRDMISILQNETNWSTLQFRALEDYTVDGTTTGEFDDEKAGI